MVKHATQQQYNTRRSIFCDFDGTITHLDVTDSLLRAFADPDWRSVEQLWIDGRIDSRECMARQIGMLDADMFSIDKHLYEIEIDPDFPEFVREQSAVGNPIYITSDGIDYAIRRILNWHGLGHLPVYANHLVQRSQTRYSLDFTNSTTGCSVGTCKCTAMNLHQDGETVVIGDGRSDYCIARRAELVFAKGDLADYCAHQGISHIPFHSFRDIRDGLGRDARTYRV